MIQDEMKHWWIYHKEKLPIFGSNDLDKAKVQDLTGCISLLLCPLLDFTGKQFHNIEQEFWMHDDLVIVGENIVKFAAKINENEPHLYEQ